MTLEQLRVFVAVAEHLHVTRAARALNMTQSAASASIAALETRCGIKLFDRIGRHIELTEAGRIFLNEAKAVLKSAARAELALSDLSGLQRGSLLLHGSQTIANYWLPPLLHRFHQSHPRISLEVVIGNTSQVARAIADGTADLGFVEGEVEDPVLVRLPIPGDTLVLVVGMRHPWAKRTSIESGELVQSSWVLRERGSGTRQVFEEALKSYGVDPDGLDVAFELPSNEAVRSAVEAGAGATVISRLVVERSLRAKSLYCVPLEFPERRFFILRHSERYRSRAEQAFLALIRDGTAPRA